MTSYTAEYWNSILPLLELWHEIPGSLRKRAGMLPLTFHVLEKSWLILPENLLQTLFDRGKKNQERLFRPSLIFQKLLGLQSRLDAWSKLGGIDAKAFIHASITLADRRALCGLGPGISVETLTASLIRKIEVGEFVRNFIKCKTPDEFLNTVSRLESKEIVLSPDHFGALKSWLIQMTENEVAFVPLNGELFNSAWPTPLTPLSVGDLVYLAQFYGLGFVVKNKETQDIVIFVPAPVDSLSQTTKKLDSPSLNPVSTFSRPYLLDDMEVYLRSLKGNAPFPLSDGFSLAVAHHRKVAKNFLALPGPLPEMGFEGENRAKAAWWMIMVLHLADLVGDRRQSGMYQINRDGEIWLALPKDKKLEQVLNRAPCGQLKSQVSNNNDLFSWLGDFQSIPFPYHALSNRVFKWMDLAFSQLEPATQLEAWTKIISTRSNPFVADAEANSELQGYWGRWYATPENAYANLLTHYYARLVSLGALSLLHDSKNYLGMTLTPIGKWIFGHTSEWTLPEETRAIAIIGADFSIHLTEPSAGLAIELTGFSEVVTPGLIFKITRRSIQGAVHHGISADEILATLKSCSKTALPSNIVHEIAAWATTKQSVHLSECVIVEGSDPITMAEILSTFPKEFIAISPLVLKYIGQGKLSVLEKKFATKGFYIN